MTAAESHAVVDLALIEAEVVLAWGAYLYDEDITLNISKLLKT